MDNFKGSTCQLTCDENYELNGDTTIECTKVGKGWSWNKSWPACDPGINLDRITNYKIILVTTTTAEPTTEATTTTTSTTYGYVKVSIKLD